MIRRIRQSQLWAYKECRRKWEFEYVRAIELNRKGSETKGARDLGSLVHRLMEAYYLNQDWRGVHAAELSALLEAGDLSPEWIDHYEYARIMMEGYGDWIKADHQDIGEEILLVEPQLEADIGTFHGDTVIFTGKPDIVKRNTASDIIIVEDHKTTGRIESVMLHAPQGNSYAMLLKMQHGLDVGLFRTNQLRKVKRTARANPPFYGRSEKFVNEAELRNHYWQVKGQLDEMVGLMQYWEYKRDSEIDEYLQRFYASPGQRCKGCDYAAPCTTINEGGNVEYVIRNFYRPKPVNAFDGSEETPDE